MKTWIILSITAALSQGYSVRTPADTFPIVSNVFPFKNLEILTNNLEQKETQEEEFVVDNLKSLVSLDDQDENTDEEDVVESGSRARTLIGTISLINHHQRHNLSEVSSGPSPVSLYSGGEVIVRAPPDSPPAGL